MKRICLSLAAVLALACGGGSSASSGSSAAPTTPAPPYAWIQSQSHALSGVSPSLPDTELAPFGDMVGDAHMVGLGEATHGTSEFFQMKDRLLRYLVLHKGFTAFGIEADMARCLTIDAYVQGGPGDAATAILHQGFWTWDTQEVVDLVEWMRAYNLDGSHAVKLHFFGFDMQDGAAEMDQVISFLHGVDPAAETSLAALYLPLRPYAGFDNTTRQDYSAASAAVRADCHAKVQQAYQWMVDHEASYAAASTSAMAAQGTAMALAVVQFEAMSGASPDSYGYLRDSAMATNAIWWQQQLGAGTRCVLWAHNGHVNKGPLYPGYDSMGMNLRAALGTGYLSLGFGLHGGTFRVAVAQPGGGYVLETMDLPPAPEGSIDLCFSDAGVTTALFDFRGLVHGSEGPDWMLAPHGLEEIGSTFDPNQPYSQITRSVIPDCWDLFIYVRDTHASVSIMPGAALRIRTPQMP